MASFVLGFLFDPKFEQVVLIRKERPAWQAGALNGVGGKVEPGEAPAEALQREFNEEAGVHVHGWAHYVTEFFPEGKLDVYWAASQDIDDATTMTDERIEVRRVTEVLGGQLKLVDRVAEYVNLALRCQEGLEAVE